MKQTTLCYIEHAHRYLMLHRTRKENDANHDKWLGIGGHIEPGETPMQCILREAKEETGLTLTDCRYRGIVHFRSERWEDEDMHLFTASEFEGSITSCDEGELEWIDQAEVLSLTLWEGDRIFLKLLQEGAQDFELSLWYDADEHLIRAELDGSPVK